jgi:cytochrome b
MTTVAPHKRIPVWDPLVRLFHWSLLAAFITVWISGEDYLPVHTTAGYIVLALLALRVVWGFVGSVHARFADFVYAPSDVLRFVRLTLLGKSPSYRGHNPAAGLMVLALLLSLFLTCLPGLLLYGAMDQQGPLAAWLNDVSLLTTARLERLHEFMGNLTLWLVVLHISGVILESGLQREDLARAMITGYKSCPATDHKEETNEVS